MSEQNPYEELGLGEDASFDEIQQARTRLIADVDGDRQKIERIEAAYDAVLMHRLRLRQEGRIKVPERIRYPEKSAPPTAELPTLPTARLPQWMQQLIDRPSPNDILWPALVCVSLMGITVFSSSSQALLSLLQFILVAAVVSTAYFLNRKEGRLGRSVFIAMSGLLLGLLVGALVALPLEPLLGLAAISAPVFATLTTLVLLWVVSSFAK